MEDRDRLGLIVEFELPDGFDLREVAFDRGADGCQAVASERTGLEHRRSVEGIEGDLAGLACFAAAERLMGGGEAKGLEQAAAGGRELLGVGCWHGG